MDDIRFQIDQFSVWGDSVRLAGWVLNPGVAVAEMLLRVPESADLQVNFGQPSPDVAKVFGKQAGSARFEGQWHLSSGSINAVDAVLVIRFADDVVVSIDRLGSRGLEGDATRDLMARFLALLAASPSGELLELGSRARSGVSRRGLAPARWSYTGMDVLDGENVDVVGDAHKLSSLFPSGQFDAVMAFSVLEHILMPWKVAIELNQVMRVGAVGFFMTHQCWPIHDQPWDYWRFSADSWKALFNFHTGFEILDAKMGEPGFVVARNCHPATNFGRVANGYLASSVLFRKIGETSLRWDVDGNDVIDAPYPATTTKVVLG